MGFNNRVIKFLHVGNMHVIGCFLVCLYSIKLHGEGSYRLEDGIKLTCESTDIPYLLDPF